MSDSQTGVSRVEDMLEHQCYGIAAEQQKNVACLKGDGRESLFNRHQCNKNICKTNSVL